LSGLVGHLLLHVVVARRGHHGPASGHAGGAKVIPNGGDGAKVIDGIFVAARSAVDVHTTH